MYIDDEGYLCIIPVIPMTSGRYEKDYKNERKYKVNKDWLFEEVYIIKP